jgi:uncharacterized membrane protein
MTKVRVLLAGETWTSTTFHVKGFDLFSSSDRQSGLGPLLRALDGSDIDIVHLPGERVPGDFPSTREEFDAYDVIVLSDVGANSILLHPDTFLRGQRTPNRLAALADWVRDGGGYMMIGGYLTVQGSNGSGRYKGTPAEAILPVDMLAHDDRIEVPEGFHPHVISPGHPTIAGIEGDWPYLLGLNEVTVADGGEVILTTGSAAGNHPLLVAGTHGKGRTLAWMSDIGPHWLPTAFSDWDGYARLWTQSFRWLSGRV